MEKREGEIGLRWRLARRLFPMTLVIGFVVSIGLPGTYYFLESRAQTRTANIYAQELSEKLHDLLLEAPALWKYQAQK